MAGQVTWAETAWEDLDQIAAYIARDSPHYAGVVVQRLIDSSQSLDRFAQRGRIVPELSDPTLREVFVYSYRLIYKIHAQGVHVVAVIHGARDLPALWAREGRAGRHDP